MTNDSRELTARDYRHIQEELDITHELASIFESGGELSDYGRGAVDMLRRIATRMDDRIIALEAQEMLKQGAATNG